MRKKEQYLLRKKEKHQFNDLIKVLRPKVFITDSSNFKRLVQELTGNGSPISSPSHVDLPRTKNIPVLDIEGPSGQQESSLEASVEEYVGSVDLCNQLFLSEGGGQVGKRAYMDDHAAFDPSKSTMQREDLSAYRDFESWLLNGDESSFSFFNCYAESEQQVRI